mmetsp:Transcript_11040/g.18298  ORF Transcript_11040/g.18298 Transcript_11040/m.18298 type:complete len:186 (-) Transcript_11040:78-635(-)
MIQGNTREEGTKRETFTTIVAEVIAIMRTIAIEEEEDVMSEDNITTIKITIQIQCPLSLHILLMGGVEDTHHDQGATGTMSMIGAIVDMIVTEDTQDPEATGNIIGTIMTTSQGDKDTKDPEATGSSVNTNLGAVERTEVMITMTTTPILQIRLVKIIQILIVTQDAMEQRSVYRDRRPSQSHLD